MPEIVTFQYVRDSFMLAQGEVLPPPQYVNAYVLVAATAQDVTVPALARIAIFSSTNNFYVNWLTTAAEPSANVTDGSGAELNPVARDVSAIASFSIVAPVGCIVTVAYFS